MSTPRRVLLVVLIALIALAFLAAILADDDESVSEWRAVSQVLRLLAILGKLF